MLEMIVRDLDGKLVAGFLFLDNQLVQRNWVKRLRKAGFDYLFEYADKQGSHSIMFAKRAEMEKTTTAKKRQAA